jgi:tetratricopeptide (TPR) repeat protein
MKSFAPPTFAFITTVSLIGLVTLGTVRNIITPESQLRTETTITQVDSKEAIAHFNRGSSYAQQKRRDLAIAEYTIAIELDPLLAIAYNNRGYLYSQQGNPDLALADYNKAIELDPLLAIAYNNRGYLYSQQGNLDLALADYTRALELDPQIEFAKSALKIDPEFSKIETLEKNLWGEKIIADTQTLLSQL